MPAVLNIQYYKLGIQNLCIAKYTAILYNDVVGGGKAVNLILILIFYVLQAVNQFL